MKITYTLLFTEARHKKQSSMAHAALAVSLSRLESLLLASVDKGSSTDILRIAGLDWDPMEPDDSVAAHYSTDELVEVALQLRGVLGTFLKMCGNLFLVPHGDQGGLWHTENTVKIHPKVSF